MTSRDGFKRQGVSMRTDSTTKEGVLHRILEHDLLVLVVIP